MNKRKILDFIQSFNDAANSSPIYEPYSFLENNEPLNKTKKENIFEKHRKKKTIFQEFFLKFHIKFYENLLEIEKNETIGIIGIIENIQTYSKEALKTNNLSLLVGTHKFPSCDIQNQNEETISQNKIFFKDDTAKIELIIDESHVKWLTTESELKTTTFNKNLLINGLIIALIGETTDYQKFLVNTIIFEGISTNQIRNGAINNISGISLKTTENLKNSKYVVIISDIEIFHDKSNESLLLFEEFITTGVISENISRIIILGNVFENFQSLQNALQSTTKSKEMYQNAYFIIDSTIDRLKMFIDSIRKKNRLVSIDVILDSNEDKYREILFDLFAKGDENENEIENVSDLKKVNFFYNPYFFQINDIKFLGVTGQNIKELKYYWQYSKENDINLMQYICFWGNLWPFNIANKNYEIQKSENKFPHVYFQGGGEKYCSMVFCEENSKAVCNLITIPSFADTKSCVLFDLSNFHSCEINFN